MENTPVVIRPETRADYEIIRRVNKKAFKGKSESKLVDAVREEDGFIPELSLVAVKDGAVVGHILFSPIVIEGEAETPALALAPMSVLPEFQNMGIGTAMVNHGLEECRRLGHKLVVLVGHEAFYPRFGFVKAGEKGLKLPFEAPPEVFMVLELAPGALNGAAGEVVYPRAFLDIS
jgi:putative acetyltransferase